MTDFDKLVHKFQRGEISAEQLVGAVEVELTEPADDSTETQEVYHSYDSVASLYSFYYTLSDEQQKEVDAEMSRRFGK